MKRNRTKLFALNTTASALQQIVLFVVGLIIPSICLEYYGSETNGLVSSITQFISYITLIEAGISASMVYYLYKPLSENDCDKISSIVSAARITYRKLGIAVVGLSALLAVGYMLLSKVDGLSHIDMFVLVLAMGVSGSLEFFTMARYRVLLTADQRTYVLCLATIVGSVLNAVVTIVCALLGLSIVWLKIIAIFTVFARSIVLTLYFKKHYRNINVHAAPDYSSQNKRWDALYMQILWNLQSGAPVLIVTAFTDFVQVSVYIDAGVKRVVCLSTDKAAYASPTHEVTLGEIVELLKSFKAQPQTLVLPEIPPDSFAKKLYSTYLSYLPQEKVAFPLKMNVDERGSFTELLKTRNCGQFSVNISKPGITKGQHWHNSKWEFFMVVSGHGLIQERKIGSEEILEFEVDGDHIQAVHMLPGYTHNIINLSDTENLVTVMWANEQFDPSHPDTFGDNV